MTQPQPKPSILEIEPYKQGKSKAAGAQKMFKLSSNETPLGASPKAKAAYLAEVEHLELYHDGSAPSLRAAIGGVYGIEAQRIICGAGSDEVLNLIAYAYLQAGDEAIYTRHGFLVYPIAIRSAGATPVVVSERDLHTDVDAILAAVTTRTKMVFIANPNNPTGTYISADEVRRLHAGLPDHVILVLDGAYAEYVQEHDYSDGLELAKTAQNVVVTHTFSKIYGLAGLRLGWGYASAGIIDVLNRIRGPFNISSSAVAAGIAAVEDQRFMQAAIAHNTKWCAFLVKEIAALGLTVTPSVANFILINFPETGAHTATAADAFLTQRGFILRAVGNYHLPHALRLTVGSEEACKGVVAALTEFMKGE